MKGLEAHLQNQYFQITPTHTLSLSLSLKTTSKMSKHNNDDNKNILAIFGATGHQGSSIIHYVQNDATLSQKYPIIRAITRDVNSDQAKQLALSNNNSHVKIEVVRGDAQDSTSLAAALAGAHTVFAMTTPDFGPDAVGAEYARTQAIADAAVSQGVEYLVFSTLPAVGEISGGKYARVTPFDAKAKAERYIRGLPIRSAFVSNPLPPLFYDFVSLDLWLL